MDARAAKLALARKKLKDHQDKKLVSCHKDENVDVQQQEEPLLVSEEPLIAVDQSQNYTETENILPQTLVETCTVNKNNDIQNLQVFQSENANVTEILISNKTSLEIQIVELQAKLSQLESNHTLAINNNNICKQQIDYLEKEVKNLNEKYVIASENVQAKDRIIQELHDVKLSLSNDNSNLQEQLEFTKTMLTAKETENASLHSQLANFQNQLEVAKLQLQQLTNGSHAYFPDNNSQSEADKKTEVMSQTIYELQRQLKTLQKEKEQLNLHYQHYVGELNEQLNTVVVKNGELSEEIQNLSIRESNLIEQISTLEIRLQKYLAAQDDCGSIKSNVDVKALQQNYGNIKALFEDLSNRYDILQKKYNELEIKCAESEMAVKVLKEAQESECTHDHENNISIEKLNADIESDKVAAQRATEQNKKLKADLQELEEAFVKISKDKLELTEKLGAEKYLNRELTIKLAEIDEKAKDMRTKLMAKDEEMIRLQSNCRDIERKFEMLSQDTRQSEQNVDEKCQDNEIDTQQDTHNHSEEDIEVINKIPVEIGHDYCNHDHYSNGENNSKIPKEDAMHKLQERFLKIMGEVADLSDEKHRLEHIILQLQNETDTICEYVALYQQQRILLKQRDEERSAQIKIFQSECERLRSQIEELKVILVRLLEDKELSTYFHVESRQIDVTKIMNLLSHLKNNSLIDPHKKSSELKDFYPCSCCSGQLIDV